MARQHCFRSHVLSRPEGGLPCTWQPTWHAMDLVATWRPPGMFTWRYFTWRLPNTCT